MGGHSAEQGPAQALGRMDQPEESPCASQDSHSSVWPHQVMITKLVIPDQPFPSFVKHKAPYMPQNQEARGCWSRQHTWLPGGGGSRKRNRKWRQRISATSLQTASCSLGGRKHSQERCPAQAEQGPKQPLGKSAKHGELDGNSAHTHSKNPI